MEGQRFGKLVVLREAEVRTKDRRIQQVCRCDCGNTHTVATRLLTSGKTKSCGCYRWQEKDPNAARNHPLFKTYSSMKTRCYNENSDAFRWYGAIGIKVCDRWLESFWNFVEDVGERPEGKTLDRIDGYKDYSPDNCRWATLKEQCENRKPNSGWRKKRWGNA